MDISERLLSDLTIIRRLANQRNIATMHLIKVNETQIQVEVIVLDAGHLLLVNLHKYIVE